MGTKKIMEGFKGWPKKYAYSDIIIVGAGPAGLMAAVDLGKHDLKVLVIEKNVYAGGGLGAGDFLISASSYMPEVREILDELKIPYKKGKSGLSVNAGLNIPAKLVSAVCDRGVKILNMAEFTDLICGDEKVEGLVMNWMPPAALKNGADVLFSINLKCQMVIDVSGPEARVCSNLIEKCAIKPNKFEGEDIGAAERFLLESAGIVYPGLAAAGMAAATIYGIPHEGLSLCSMLLSGRKIAQEVEMSFTESFMPLPKKWQAQAVN